jgi:hypothetical protein
MAIPILHDMDFNQNQALNFVMHLSTSATRPANPVDGQQTFDTETRTILTYNESTTSWDSVSDQDAILEIEGTAPVQASEEGNRKVTISVDEATDASTGVIQLTGDLGGTATAPTVELVGGAVAADVADAVTRAHDQNTDTGTDSATFQLDGNLGPMVKAESATEIQFRNAGDDDFVSVRVKDLFVEGTTTIINSNEVDIGDSEIVLNSDIATSGENSDGGVAVKRLQTDNTTRADAKVTFNNSTGRWSVVDGPIAAPTTFELARKISFNVGDGTNVDFVLTHNMDTRDVEVVIRENAGTFRKVLTDVEMTSVNTVTVKFKKAPTAAQYRVTIIG